MSTSIAEVKIFQKHTMSLNLAIKPLKQWSQKKKWRFFQESYYARKGSSQRESMSLGKRFHPVLITSHSTLQDETEVQTMMG